MAAFLWEGGFQHLHPVLVDDFPAMELIPGELHHHSSPLNTINHGWPWLANNSTGGPRVPGSFGHARPGPSPARPTHSLPCIFILQDRLQLFGTSMRFFVAANVRELGCFHWQSIKELLVGGIPTPLNNMKVKWDDYSQYMRK